MKDKERKIFFIHPNTFKNFNYLENEWRENNFVKRNSSMILPLTLIFILF